MRTPVITDGDDVSVEIVRHRFFVFEKAPDKTFGKTGIP